MGDVDHVALAGVPRREILLSAGAWFKHVFRPWYRWWLKNQPKEAQNTIDWPGSAT